ncbi:tubulin-specific chaperone D-like isoform X1 [Stylophora pistillata]|uniref:Tubulin-specific chaperone D n=1 Tax=Stylophora pistillata TaxID=50429 RepID=A0A2B4SLY4_STYPI|nr:tubulin-specific chaperone D-like isoform X1 [Stylophora pistillata]PFX29522.1 Tubulin-specific chaperone D [Stylophora pistillata]
MAVKEDDNSVTYSLDHFTELKEVTSLIESIGTICHDNILLEAAEERLILILNKYQEQPHLLDPHLESLVKKLQHIVCNASNLARVIQQAFKYLYFITKVRGPKYVVRLFSHEVTDVEPLLRMLSQQNPQDHETWETRYVLLLWLSIVCMIPFDMARFDGLRKASDETQERCKPVVERILETAKMYLSVPDKSRDAAALVISKFVTRPDVKKEKLAEFLDWCLIRMEKANGETMDGMLLLTGILTTLALLFKHGKRDDLIPYAPTVLKQIGAREISNINNTLLRKLNIKLTQRLGLTFLKPRIAAWRYQRGSRSLAFNLENPFSQEENENGHHTTGLSRDEEEDYDVPEELEDIIEKLLTGLRDKDTVVRWSAAKGIGRITGRLPQELADQIVENVLELFSSRESDSGWHGGCLALAELGRRGLLLPDRLPEVVPVVLKALSYDEMRGTYSVGSHVRDGACYVCWSFARAYDPKEIQPHVHGISSSLIIAALFDREVNCRRAASAAFQENVGRQGTFPHGIDILTMADYFAVGNRVNTYLTVSVSVAAFKEYTKALIDHLANVKLQHWDRTIRELASQALHNLTPSDPEYMAKTVFPRILSQTNNIDLNTRHGCILGCSEVIHALFLYTKGNGRLLTDLVDKDCFEIMKDFVPQLNSAKSFRGLGGDYMRQAVCHLIMKLSLSELPWHGDQIIGVFQDTIDDNLSHTEPIIQEGAVRALGALCEQYYVKDDGVAIDGIQDSIITHYVGQLKSPSEFSRVGFAQALGFLPKFILSSRLKVVFTGLITASQLADDPGKFAESRREALKSLARIACTVGLNRTGDEEEVVTEGSVHVLYEAFFVAMNDYTIDSRGDVGAWVREASMSGLETLTRFVVESDHSLFTPEICERVMCCLAQQSSEKIDRTRAHAGEIFLRLLYMDSPRLPHIPHHEELLDIFPKDKCLEMNWSASAECFPRITKLLGLASYRKSVLLGLTVSVGGLTESLVRHSHSSLLRFLKVISKSEPQMNEIAEALLDIFRKNEKNDRIIVPLFKMLDMLLANGCFELFAQDESHPFPAAVFNLTKKEIFKIGDARKLLTSVSVFCGLLQFPGATRTRAFQQLSIFLCHRYPQVRKSTADHLYSAVLTYDDIIPAENFDEVLAILTETSWDVKIEELRVIRNRLCDIIGIPHPVLKSSTAPNTVKKKKDELDSYKDLVSRGY